MRMELQLLLPLPANDCTVNPGRYDGTVLIMSIKLGAILIHNFALHNAVMLPRQVRLLVIGSHTSKYSTLMD